MSYDCYILESTWRFSSRHKSPPKVDSLCSENVDLIRQLASDDAGTSSLIASFMCLYSIIK